MLGHAAPRLTASGLIAWPALDPAVLRQVTAILLAAVMLETGLLRLITRVGVHLPKDESLRGVFHGASILGSLAFNFASILAIALTVFLLLALALRLESAIGKLALVSLLAAMLGSLGLSLATGAAAADALFMLTMALLVVLIGLVLASPDEKPAAGRLALALIVAAYLCYQYYTLGYLLYQMRDSTAVLPLGITALRAGEGLVVAAGAAAFLAWGAGRWRQVGPGGLSLVAVVLVALAVAAVSPASTIPILILWNNGLSLFLPLPVYLLSLGLFLVTLVACWRSGDAFWTVAGLGLLLLAGYMPEATYHHLLLLLGVAFLSGAFPWATSSSMQLDHSVQARGIQNAPLEPDRA